ncbi:nucleotidyltransferase domain-containing protein [Peribacillus sp. NPDC096447]|uniref:SMODS domain-containing nucleotidyltransferase n=1 Tax=Peribacillus sp. NPDC096447 TaxID=3364394 RepID=UPI0038096B37
MGTYDNFNLLVHNARTQNHALVSERYERITRRLNLDFRGLDSTSRYSRYVGSYGRGTAIKGFSDVDMLIELPYDTYVRYNNYLGNGQSALLQEVRASIKTTYTNTDIGGDGQVIVVNFSDGMTFEVVPAFINKGGESYTYPDSNYGGTWKVTYPILEINAINELNNKYNKNVKKLVRIMKAWRNQNNVPISGMLLETLVMNFLDGYEHKDRTYGFYDWMTRDFLKYLSERNPDQSFWNARGSGDQVYRKGKFEYKARQGYLKSIEAIENDKKYPSIAYQTWRDIFGNYYPS